MKVLSRLLLVFLAGYGSLASAQAPQQGSFRLMNATGLPQNVTFTVDGAKLKKDGFPDGFVSSGIGVLAGSHTFVATYAAGGSAQQVVPIANATGCLVYAYTKSKVDPATQKSTRTLAVGVRITPLGVKGKRITVFNLSEKTASISVGGQARNIEPAKESTIEDYRGMDVTAESGGNSLGKFATEEPGNYLIVLYDNPLPPGGLKAAYAADY